jgi:hypothetical protein
MVSGREAQWVDYDGDREWSKAVVSEKYQKGRMRRVTDGIEGF